MSTKLHHHSVYNIYTNVGFDHIKIAISSWCSTKLDAFYTDRKWVDTSIIYYLNRFNTHKYMVWHLTHGGWIDRSCWKCLSAFLVSKCQCYQYIFLHLHAAYRFHKRYIHSHQCAAFHIDLTCLVMGGRCTYVYMTQASNTRIDRRRKQESAPAASSPLPPATATFTKSFNPDMIARVQAIIDGKEKAPNELTSKYATKLKAAAEECERFDHQLTQVRNQLKTMEVRFERLQGRASVFQDLIVEELQAHDQEEVQKAADAKLAELESKMDEPHGMAGLSDPPDQIDQAAPN
jgi:hypothetical protein